MKFAFMCRASKRFCLITHADAICEQSVVIGLIAMADDVRCVVVCLQEVSVTTFGNECSRR